MKEGRAKILKRCILGVLLGYAVLMAVWARGEASRHSCTGIEINVQGATPAMDSTIRQGVAEEMREYPHRIIGLPLRQVNTGDVERYLSKRGSFESVRCMMSARGTLVIKIEPLVPVMRIFYGGNSYYINKEGRHMTSNAEFYSEVPLVTGSFNRSFQPRDVLPLVNYIASDALLSGLVGMVHAEDRDNLVLVPRIRGHVVNFGDTTRLDEKKEALALFYRQVMPYKGWEEYDTISVRFRGQVVATRRDKTRLNHAEQYIETEDMEEGTLPDAGTQEQEQTQI